MPAIDHAVPHSERGRDIPVAVIGGDAVLTDLIVELLLDAVPHGGDITGLGLGSAFLIENLDDGWGFFLERHESLSPQRSGPVRAGGRRVPGLNPSLLAQA
jgi:hypothetical protein